MKRNLLAWNFSYPTLELFGQLSMRSTSDLPFSPSTLSGSDVSANPGFDFFAMPVPQAGSSKIVFTSNRDGNAEIYSMNADGSSLSRLTTNDFNDDHPRWSPDGTKILFQSDRDNPETGNADVYVMNANGSGQTRLTTDVADDSAAAWSPDGAKIVFQSLRNGQFYQVYEMNADGSNQVNKSNGIAADYQPSWSPDGAKIAFASERDHAGHPSVYVMNSNGSNQTRLTFTGEPFRDEQPAWSRDAARIAFVSTRDSVIETWQETDDEGGILNRSRVRTNKEVYKMNADGSNQIRLTNTLENDDSPYWSPDGTQIIFRSDRERDAYDPTQQLWTMYSDGTGQALISGNEFGDYSPSWNTSAANQSPVAIPGGPYSGVVAQNVPFNGSASFDPDGNINSYSWSFGDGGTGSGAVPTHTYTSTGTYTVTLTVTDNQGAQATANTSVTITAAGSEQYLANFNLSALARPPSPEESAYWNDILRAAYANGQNSMLLAVRELGKTLFESADYADLNRNNHWYVYDLYKTYLMREPDAPGWAWWENECNSYGRDNVRRAFDESIEFGNIVATLTPSGSPSTTVSSFVSARVDPFNQPRNGLVSRDTDWSVPLLSLPGRAGLDLGLSLSYSSMVWTRSGPYIYFDEDNGWPSPGFRLGFPTIQEKVFDAQAGDNVYLLIAGSRVSLRQIGTSNVYEAADSSYLQLIDNGGTLLVRATDGTQLSYSKFNNEWHCSQIKDRNGNYITVNYDWLGHITTITDTLARTITFNYDPNANLTSITQSWTVNGVPTTHTWATFGWTTKTLNPSFSTVMVVGAPGGSIPVLSQVGLGDGSRHTFEYTDASQVSIIKRFAQPSDNTPRAYTAYDYEYSAADCPRLSATRVAAENWTGINGVPTEVVTQYGVEGSAHTLSVVGDPNSTLYKEFYGAGWQRGLTTQTEVWSAGVKQKWTGSNWTQDNTAVNYQTNPRVTETNVHDPSNHRRTTIEYQTFALPSGASCSLPSDTRAYAGSASTALRHTHTDYRMNPVADSAYLNLHIFGLVKQQTLFEVNGGSETPMSKVGFQYDETGSIFGSDAPVGHDNSYNGNFVMGRGNLSSVKRYDVTVTDNSQFTISRLTYNTAGAVVSTKDPLNHEATVSYVDSFSADGANLDAPRPFATLAFPTTITDADGHSSHVRYHYDIGAKTRAQGPTPENHTQGAIQIFAYDAAARIERVTTANNNAYRRFVYGPNYVQTFATVNNVADEAYAIQLFDGAGRVTGTASNHPGSAGGYSAQNTVYDLMGRAVKQSNPAEINEAWNPAGDDVAGCLFTQQTYNWQGKPLVTTNTDGTTKEASYSGCGCAGGAVVTLTDEGTMDAGVFKRREQNIYTDVLGRTVKTELLNWQGGSVYATTVNTYNVRDQITSVKQYQGPESSGVDQETNMTFDGYGRLNTRHAREQDAGTSTIWDYNADDTIQRIRDARGSIANFNYNNNRHLVTSITYDPVSGVTDTPDVSFGYDAAGNRTSMTDGSGSTTYQVNQLSQLVSETRQFSGLTGSYTLSYQYNLAGELKKITEPAGSYVDYAYDTAGRMESVSGAGLGTSQYASSMQYRAWGGLKSMAYGNTTSLSLNFNQRGQVTQYAIGGVKAPVTGAIQPEGGDFQYYADGQVKFASDLRTDATAFGLHDRAYSYDHAARLKEAYSGTEARDFVNGTSSGVFDGAFRQTYNYDTFGNLTTRTGRFWSEADNASDSYNSQNRNPAWEYDADGRLISRNEPSPNGLAYQALRFSYDAAGRRTQSTQTTSRQSPNPNSTVIFTTVTTRVETYDGDGVGGKSATTTQINGGTPVMTTTFYLRSTVLGGRTISEYDSAGVRQNAYVFAGGEVLAQQQRMADGTTRLLWEHNNPATGDGLNTDAQGASVGRTTVDPMGVDLGDSDPFVSSGGNEGGGDGMSQSSIDAKVAQLIPGYGGPQVKLDGFITSPYMVFSAASRGAAEQCPNNDCSLRSVTVNVTWQNGDKRTFNGFIGPLSGIPDGFNHTYTGVAAVAAATEWNAGLNNGGFQNALVESVSAGNAIEELLTQVLLVSQGPQNPTPAPTPQVSAECQAALDAANMDINAITRANAAADVLRRVGEATGMYPETLAAIGVRETGFQNVAQAGGFGRGIFQIDIGANPQAAGITGDTEAAATFAAQFLTARMNYHSNVARLYPESNYNVDINFGAAIRDYNARHTATRRIMRRPGATVADLDRGTARNNYVSNVLNLSNHCFKF